LYERQACHNNEAAELFEDEVGVLAQPAQTPVLPISRFKHNPMYWNI
jgi:hypothetical protein